MAKPGPERRGLASAGDGLAPQPLGVGGRQTVGVGELAGHVGGRRAAALLQVDDRSVGNAYPPSGFTEAPAAGTARGPEHRGEAMRDLVPLLGTKT